MYRKELLKGSTETILLALLVDGPMYGYQLVEEMDTRSGGYFRFKEGTLYPALHRLDRDELIEGSWQRAPTGQARRYYYITAPSMIVLAWMSYQGGRGYVAVFIFVAVSLVVLLSPALFDLKGARAEPSARRSDVTPSGLPDAVD